MAGLFKRLFGRRDERAAATAPDIEAMLDWSPGPPAPPPPVFRVAPPPPPPPPPAPEGSAFDESTRVLWGVPPPPPPPPMPEGHDTTRSRPRIRLMLTDGSVVHPPTDPAWHDRFVYLAENLLPPRTARDLPKVKIVLADGSVIESAEDSELQARIQYLAENLLPRPR